MSISVKFYQFKKRINSTIRPDQLPIPGLSPVAQYDCILKAGCGIMSPVLSLDVGITSNPTGFNYAYIADFGRYYYVKEWQWSERLWHIYLEEDILASFKTDILNSSCFVLRSASSSDLTLTDDFYPAKATAVNKVNQATSNPWPADLSSGYYVVGIINTDSGAVGSVSYYVMTNSQFKTLCSTLMSSTSWLQVPNDFLNGGMNEKLLRTLFNPIQYISSVKWFPVAPPTNGSVSDLPYGWWSLTGVSASKLDADGVATTSFTIPIPDHPQASSRGEYLNAAPYTKLTLFAGPFGEIPLDGTIYTRNQSIRCDVAIDCISGIGTMEMNVDILASYPNTITNMRQAQIGVDIQISQMSVDKLAQAETVVTGALDVTAGALHTAAAATNITALINPIGGALSAAAQGAQTISTGVHAIANGIRASIPQMLTSGVNGSLSAYYFRPYVQAECFELVAEDLSDFGRPLAQNKTLSTLSGYVLCKDPHVQTYGTINETAGVNAYLESGVFLE